MKVVVNRCYGGFGLSQKAIELYFELQGWKLVTEGESSFCPTYYKDKKSDKNYWYDGNLERDDPILIQVVETLEDAANGTYAELKIVEIPENISWEIDDDDGMETVEEKHRSW
jgi:hypothetical protein